MYGPKMSPVSFNTLCGPRSAGFYRAWALTCPWRDVARTFERRSGRSISPLCTAMVALDVLALERIVRALERQCAIWKPIGS